MKAITQPVIVPIQDIRNPTTLPKTSLFIAIKTANGKKGNIDSKTTIKNPTNSDIKMLLFKIIFSKYSIILCIN